MSIENSKVEEEHPNCSWIKLKMYNNMNEEVGSISLDNADSVYLARKILESLTFI